jgi:uncharacterized surface protein with fasciclin (FAS1) repeats
MTGYTKGMLSAVVALGVFVVMGLSPANAGGYSYGTKSTKADIVDTAVAAGNFNTLVAAVQAAGLVDTLKGKGPFTVFAPTDEAFAKIPKAQLDALLADKEALTAVLTYHVVPGKIMSSDLLTERMTTAKTVQGESINIDARISVKVNDANVVKADIVASNGVVHVIDSVILPPSAVSAIQSDLRVASAFNPR